MNETINLYQYLANEAMLYLKKNNNNEEVKALLETIENTHPKFTNKEPDPNLITKLCLMSEEIKNKEKSLKERGHQTQNRRENQRGDNSCNRRSSGNSERPFYGSWRSDDRNQVGSQRGRSWRSEDRNQERSQRERSWRSDDRNQERSQRGRSWRSDDQNQERSQRERSDNYNRGQNRSRSDEEKGFWRRQE